MLKDVTSMLAEVKSSITLVKNTADSALNKVGSL